MVFKNEKQLKDFFLKKCKNAIEITQENVRQEMINQAQSFYDDYDPVLYERTEQLSDVGGETEKFIMRSPIILSPNGCRAEVYLDASSLNYVTGKQPTGEQVLNTAVQGLHGVKDGDGWLYRKGYAGVSIWDSQLQSKSVDMLKNELRRQRMPIK